jgi:hypothetical protein
MFIPVILFYYLFNVKIIPVTPLKEYFDLKFYISEDMACQMRG